MYESAPELPDHVAVALDNVREVIVTVVGANAEEEPVYNTPLDIEDTDEPDRFTVVTIAP